MKTRAGLFAAVAVGILGMAGFAVSQQQGVEFDTDRLGGDYREVHLSPGQGYEVCAKTCVEERQCQAWTWVPQGAQRAEGPNCWLKDTVPDAGRQGGLISGLRGAGLAPTQDAVATGAGDARIVLFNGDNFGGRYVSLTDATPSLHTEQLDFGDGTWSLAANGRWEVCEHVGFEGQCRIFEGDHATLGDFAGTISSVRYAGPGASSAVLNQTDPRRRSTRTQPGQPQGQVPGVVGRTGQAAADEVERRVQDRIREGIGRIF